MPPFRDSEGVGRTPRGPMFRNSGGVGTPPRAVIFREILFYLIPVVIPMIPGIIIRNSGGVGRTPRGTMFRNSGRVGRYRRFQTVAP